MHWGHFFLCQFLFFLFLRFFKYFTNIFTFFPRKLIINNSLITFDAFTWYLYDWPSPLFPIRPNGSGLSMRNSSIIFLIFFQIFFVLKFFSLSKWYLIIINVLSHTLMLLRRNLIFVNVCLAIGFIHQFKIFFNVSIEDSVIEDILLWRIPFLFQFLFLRCLNFSLFYVFNIIILSYPEFMLNFKNFLSFRHSFVPCKIWRNFFQVYWSNFFHPI